MLKSSDLAKIVGPVVYASSWQQLESLATQHPGSPAIVDPDLNHLDASRMTRPTKTLGRSGLDPPIIEYPCLDVQDRSTKPRLRLLQSR